MTAYATRKPPISQRWQLLAHPPQIVAGVPLPAGLLTVVIMAEPNGKN